jgi:hypothetical protein
MKKLVAMVVLAMTVLAAAIPMAEAGGGAALGLAAFAAFTSLLAFPYWAYAYAPPVYPYPAPAYYAAAPVTYAAPAVSYAAPPAVQREVVYAHGRHVLYGDGVNTAYQWVWIPNAPPPPPAGAPPPPPAGTPPAPPGR